MIKIVTIIGARPQIIKAAAFSRAVRELFSHDIKEVIVHTGQHYDESMSAVFMRELNIPAEDYNLKIGSASHAKQTAAMMNGIEDVLLITKPDAVIIYGDTNSTLAAGITASKLDIPVIHIEAGLRSYNKRMPEEINRICCDHVSTYLYAPTKTAVNNLQKEGFGVDSHGPFTIDNPRVLMSGDIMYDNSLYFAGVAAARTSILQKLHVEDNDFILATVHRESNTDNRDTLEHIFKALIAIAEQYESKIVIPLHPRTHKMMKLLPAQVMSAIKSKLTIIEPASFLDMIQLESSCSMVITDSGGVQKEAYFFNKPCIILRSETEWVELVDSGNAVLAGTDTDRIVRAYENFRNKVTLSTKGVFGDGHAAEIICRDLISNLTSAKN